MFESFCTFIKSKSDNKPSGIFLMKNSESVKPQGIAPGDKMKYVKCGHMAEVEVLSIDPDANNNGCSIEIKLKNERIIKTSNFFLKQRDETDIASIPETNKEYVECCENLAPEIIERINLPEALTT